MTRTEWSERLSVGIELIDDQHKNWINHFNAVLHAVESNQDQAAINSTLDFLSDYTSLHFDTEEKFMTKSNYPALEEHREKHSALKQTVSDLVRDFREDGVSRPLADAINTLMDNWLAKHIQETDMAFAEFAREQGLEIPEPGK